MAPLAKNPSNIIPSLNVICVPIDTCRPAEDLVWVDIPVLHPLNPVYAAIPIPECLVDVASLIIIIRHVRIHLTSNVSHWTRKQTFCDVWANIVEIVFVVIDCAREVIHVHHLTSRLSAAILVEKWVQRRCSRNRYYRLQIFAALRGCLPLRSAFV